MQLASLKFEETLMYVMTLTAKSSFLNKLTTRQRKSILKYLHGELDLTGDWKLKTFVCMEDLEAGAIILIPFSKRKKAITFKNYILSEIPSHWSKHLKLRGRKESSISDLDNVIPLRKFLG